MKIKGTIVNKNMKLVGLLLKDKKSITSVKVEKVKALVEQGLIKGYILNENNDIVGISNKLSSLPMYDIKGNRIDNTMFIRTIIRKREKFIGAIVYFNGIKEEKKLKLVDLLQAYEYCNAYDFILKKRNDNYFITGKDNIKLENIPVIYENTDKKDKVEHYHPLMITNTNRDIVGYSDDCKELDIQGYVDYLGYKFKVTDIGCSTFANSVNLVSVKLPNTLLGIGNSAFWGCENLIDIKIPHYVLEIGDSAFAKCKNLKHIILPDSLSKLSSGLFYDCSNLTSVVIPNSVKEIDKKVFWGCDNLKYIYFKGTKDEWDNIKKDYYVNASMHNYKIVYNYQEE